MDCTSVGSAGSCRGRSRGVSMFGLLDMGCGLRAETLTELSAAVVSKLIAKRMFTVG